MCKCNPGAERSAYNNVQAKFPYCGEGNCKPSKEWEKLQKNCPWKEMRKLYGPGKNALCRGTGTEAHSFGHSWSSGDFSQYWCSEKNCAPFQICKGSRT